MLGVLQFAGACFAWGLVKASVLGVHRTGSTHNFLHNLGGQELSEELQFRFGLEQGLKALTPLSAEAARVTQAALFGLMHPGNQLDAAVGGYVYSKAFEKHGLMGSLSAHVAHNVGCWLAAK